MSDTSSSVKLQSIIAVELSQAIVGFSDSTHLRALARANPNLSGIELKTLKTSEESKLSSFDFDCAPIYHQIATLLLILDTGIDVNLDFLMAAPIRYETLTRVNRVGNMKDSNIYLPPLDTSFDGFVRANFALYLQAGPGHTRYYNHGMYQQQGTINRFKVDVVDAWAPWLAIVFGLIPVTQRSTAVIRGEISHFMAKLQKAIPGVDHWAWVCIALASLHMFPHYNGGGVFAFNHIIPSMGRVYSDDTRRFVKGLLEMSSVGISQFPHDDKLVMSYWALNVVQDIQWKSSFEGVAVPDTQLVKIANETFTFKGGFVRFRGSRVDKHYKFDFDQILKLVGDYTFVIGSISKLFGFLNYLCARRIRFLLSYNTFNITALANVNEDRIVGLPVNPNVDVGHWAHLNPLMQYAARVLDPRGFRITIDAGVLETQIPFIAALSGETTEVLEFNKKCINGGLDVKS